MFNILMLFQPNFVHVFEDFLAYFTVHKWRIYALLKDLPCNLQLDLSMAVRNSDMAAATRRQMEEAKRREQERLDLASQKRQQVCNDVLFFISARGNEVY